MWICLPALLHPSALLKVAETRGEIGACSNHNFSAEYLDIIQKLPPKYLIFSKLELQILRETMVTNR